MPLNNLIITPPIFAHRGASRYAPENTFAAFLTAHALGIRWLEFDVMLSADEQVVVIHDETLDRTTNGTGFVYEHTYAELEKLTAGAWFDLAYAKEKVPLLVDVIHFLQQHKMSANIEIKAVAGQEELTASKVLALLDQHWKSELPPLISSFSLEILKAVRRLNPIVNLGFLMDEWIPEWKTICDELQCVSVNPNYKILTPERVAEIKQTQRQIFSYTVNERKRAEELWAWGVDAVFCDCPNVLLG